VGRVFAGRIRVEAGCRGFFEESQILKLDARVPVHDIEFALDPAPTLVVQVLSRGALDPQASGEVEISRSGTGGNGGTWSHSVRGSSSVGDGGDALTRRARAVGA
jgi:hypothetical protein